jgi:hypothetical protein
MGLEDLNYSNATATIAIGARKGWTPGHPLDATLSLPGHALSSTCDLKRMVDVITCRILSSPTRSATSYETRTGMESPIVTVTLGSLGTRTDSIRVQGRAEV